MGKPEAAVEEGALLICEAAAVIQEQLAIRSTTAVQSNDLQWYHLADQKHLNE